MKILSEIDKAITAIDNGDFEKAHQVLIPLIEKEDVEALYLSSTISRVNETEDDFAQRRTEAIVLAAQKGNVNAIYELGIFYDYGYSGYSVDTLKASQLFKEAADLGHSRCQWIHACELLWGLGSYPTNVPEGLEYLEKSVNSGFDEAIVTMDKIRKSREFDI